MRLYRERLRNDPVRWAAYQELRKKQRKKEYANLKANPKKYQEYHKAKLEWDRQNKAKMKQNDPVRYKAYLAKKRVRNRRRIERLGKVYREYDANMHKDKRWVMSDVTLEDIAELKEKFLATLEKSAFIGITAQHLGLNERRVKRWMASDPEFAERVREVQSHTAERVGLALIAKAMHEGDTSAQIFICKTLGRSLGFDEKQPMVNINVGNQSDFDMTGLSIEEKDQLLQLLRKSKSKGSDNNVIDV
ncbi:MAG: hypothetical protein LBP59_10580 [Planctomycetaceae bacterium]|jgi:hypothetical protein|nr:hypothetical protein [Planctomycetaceae bacterium]